MRGDFLRKGDAVEPGTLKALHAFKPKHRPPNRLDLADWLMSAENPLTARVAVNHIWMHLFGGGLVRTSEDFGFRGENPSHPQLLDWLSVEFRRMGWSRKALIRLIVCSATYRQSSKYRPELTDADPENRWLARQDRVRLPAQTRWDRYLLVAGLLDRGIGGPGIRPPLPADIAALGYYSNVKWQQSEGADRYRRAMYIHWQRTVPFPLLTIFDAPDGLTSCVRRERSNTPLQSLARLNDPVFFECASALAGKVQAQCPPGDCRRPIEQCFRLCLAREPTSEEAERLVELWQQMTRTQSANSKAVAPLSQIARTIMNLDEFAVRE